MPGVLLGGCLQAGFSRVAWRRGYRRECPLQRKSRCLLLYFAAIAPPPGNLGGERRAREQRTAVLLEGSPARSPLPGRKEHCSPTPRGLTCPRSSATRRNPSELRSRDRPHPPPLVHRTHRRPGDAAAGAIDGGTATAARRDDGDGGRRNRRRTAHRDALRPRRLLRRGCARRQHLRRQRILRRWRLQLARDGQLAPADADGRHHGAHSHDPARRRPALAADTPRHPVVATTNPGLTPDA